MEMLLMTLGSVLAPCNIPSIYPAAKEPSKNCSKEKTVQESSEFTNPLMKLVLLTVFLYLTFVCIHTYIKQQL